MTTATPVRLCGADVRTPDDALAVMLVVRGVYQKLVKSATATRDEQIGFGMTGAPLAYLQSMVDSAVAMSQVATVAATEFQRQIDLINATVGQSGSLPGTQKGGWVDPTKK